MEMELSSVGHLEGSIATETIISYLNSLKTAKGALLVRLLVSDVVTWN